MKKLITKSIVVGILCSSGMVYGATNPIVVDAERVKTLSQDIAKNYFYITQGIQISSAKKGLKEDILKLDETLNRLKEQSKGTPSERIVEFMFFSVDELKSTLKEEYNAENGGLVLDYTETLLEGSESISSHNKGKEESLLDTLEEMEFLLERASKYYIAFKAGYTDDSNLKQARMAIEAFDKLLKKLNEANLPEELKSGPLKKLNRYWPASKEFYLGVKQNELPTIVFISTKHMMKSLEKLISYEKKQK